MSTQITTAASIATLIAVGLVSPAHAQTSRHNELATIPFEGSYVAKDKAQTLLDELYFQRAVQVYLWAMPALNMHSMKEGSEKVFVKGYNG